MTASCRAGVQHVYKSKQGEHVHRRRAPKQKSFCAVPLKKKEKTCEHTTFFFPFFFISHFCLFYFFGCLGKKYTIASSRRTDGYAGCTRADPHAQIRARCDNKKEEVYFLLLMHCATFSFLDGISAAACPAIIHRLNEIWKVAVAFSCFAFFFCSGTAGGGDPILFCSVAFLVASVCCSFWITLYPFRRVSVSSMPSVCAGLMLN